MAVQDTAVLTQPEPAGTTGGARLRGWILVVLVLGMLTQMAVGMTTAAREQNTTVDESVYVGAAVAYLRDGAMFYNSEHPPLGKLIPATGIAVLTDAKVKRPLPESQWQAAQVILYSSGNDAQKLLLAARLPMIALTLLFGLVVFFFARDVTGSWWGGAVALAVYSFSPDVMAHGSLATLDVPSAGFVLVSAWLLWRARNRPWWYLPAAGVAAGLAVATKSSVLVALPVLALLAMVSLWHHQGPRPLRNRLLPLAGAVATVAATTIATVWLVYLVADPGLRWETPATMKVVTGLKGMVVDLIPLPTQFLDGMRMQLGLEGQTFDTFLLGEVHKGHVWYYLLAALLIKTPLGALALWAAGTAALFLVKPLRPAALYLLAPPAAMLALNLLGSRPFGVRYAIFVPIFLAVVAAAVIAFQRRWSAVLAGILVLAIAASVIRAYPYYLPYSNEAFGGSANTYRNLSDSNVDWGQDLKRSADYVEKQYPGQTVWLIYKGRGNPSYYGMKTADPTKVPQEEVRGVIVISAMRLGNISPATAELVRTSRLVHTVGHSMMIYER